jgi:hypothetical protein
MRSIGMFDHVRIRASPATVAAGVAGRDGQVHGFTSPSVTGVDVIGDLRDDLAYNVHLPDRDESFWFAPDLLELLDRVEGSEIRLDGVPKRWVRSADDEWEEIDDPPPGGEDGHGRICE